MSYQCINIYSLIVTEASLVDMKLFHTQQQLEEINEKISEASSLRERVTDLETVKVRLESEVIQLKEELEEANKRAQEETNRVAAQNLQEVEDLKWKWEEEKKVSSLLYHVSSEVVCQAMSCDNNYNYSIKISSFSHFPTLTPMHCFMHTV